MKGVALKVQQMDGLSSTKIMNLHIAKAKEADQCYYSTDIQFSAQKKDLESVIFYFQNADGMYTFVQADLVSLSRNDDGDPFVPDDSQAFSPSVYASVPRRTWMLLKNFRRVGTDYLGTLFTLPDGPKKQVPITEVIDSSYRVNRVYWVNEVVEDDDFLII